MGKQHFSCLSLKGSGRKTLTAAGAARCDNLAATGGCHTCAKAVPALADELGGLVSTFHLFKYRGVRPFLVLAGKIPYMNICPFNLKRRSAALIRCSIAKVNFSPAEKCTLHHFDTQPAIL